MQVNANCYEFLRPGGRLRIAVPDGFHPEPGYIEYVRPGGTGIGADDHKVLYNYQSLRKLLEKQDSSCISLSTGMNMETFTSKSGHPKMVTFADPNDMIREIRMVP